MCLWKSGTGEVRGCTLVYQGLFGQGMSEDELQWVRCVGQGGYISEMCGSVSDRLVWVSQKIHSAVSGDTLGRVDIYQKCVAVCQTDWCGSVRRYTVLYQVIHWAGWIYIRNVWQCVRQIGVGQSEDTQCCIR